MRVSNRLVGTFRGRSGASLAYVVIVLVALLAICSLAVDLGRVRLAKGELQTAADAAARHAATGLAAGLSNETVIDRALAAAADNRADRAPVVLERTDVELGAWDRTLRQFQAGGTPVNAVRVTARRTSARNNAVPLLFATVIGRSTQDVAAGAIAACGSRADGIVGIDSIDMSSQGRTDSYNSAFGAYSAASAGSRGNMRSNGNISLGGSVTIRGDAQPGLGKTITTGPGVVVYGSTAPLTRALAFAPVDASAAAAANDNAALPARFINSGRFGISGSDVAHFPAGTYYFTGFTMSQNAGVIMDGAVTIVVDGDVKLEDGAQAYGSRPMNFVLNVAGNHVVEIKTSGDVHAVIYAPESEVRVGGLGQLFGSVVGRLLRVNAHGGIHYDESLGTGGPVGVALVR